MMKDQIVDCLANDYESFRLIADEVQREFSSRGESVRDEQVMLELNSLISDGYVNVYQYSEDDGDYHPVDFDRTKIEQLWFGLTPAGKALLGD